MNERIALPNKRRTRTRFRAKPYKNHRGATLLAFKKKRSLRSCLIARRPIVAAYRDHGLVAHATGLPATADPTRLIDASTGHTADPMD